MRIDYIEPFIEELMNVLGQVTDLKIEPGIPSLTNADTPMMGVAVVIGLAGSVYGRVIMDMTEDVALDIASQMNGEEITVLDEMALSTLGELGNMVTGSVLSRLETLGFDFDITPPTVFTGTNMKLFSAANVEALSLPLVLEKGRFEMNVSVKEKK